MGKMAENVRLVLCHSSIFTRTFTTKLGQSFSFPWATYQRVTANMKVIKPQG